MPAPNLKLEFPDGNIVNIPGGCKVIYEVGVSHADESDPKAEQIHYYFTDEGMSIDSVRGDEVIDSEVYPIDDTYESMLGCRTLPEGDR